MAHPARAAVVTTALLLLPAPSVRAQTLRGRVLEDGRNTPVAGVAVSLVDRAGKDRAQATSDSLGRFVLEPPGAGEYVLEAERLGYEPTRSPLLAIKDEGAVSIELMMTPQPIGLEGIEVSVEVRAEELLATYGQTPTSLGRRWISRKDLEDMPLTTGPGDAIRWRSVPGVWVYSDQGGAAGVKQLCVAFQRARRASGEPRCAIVLVNGTKVSPAQAAQIVADEIEAVAILTPTDASIFYGTEGGGGVVLIWTRQGGR